MTLDAASKKCAITGEWTEHHLARTDSETRSGNGS